jgi:1,4-alpha-glucan branching enzyme
VIVDVVYNHLGVSAGDMWQFDGWSENGKGGVYFYNDWRRRTDWGDTRFDYGRGEVRQYLRDNALRWLEERFADGLRWDSVGSIRNVDDRNNDPDVVPGLRHRAAAQATAPEPSGLPGLMGAVDRCSPGGRP